jgi:hypothetical protein
MVFIPQMWHFHLSRSNTLIGSMLWAMMAIRARLIVLPFFFKALLREATPLCHSALQVAHFRLDWLIGPRLKITPQETHVIFLLRVCNHFLMFLRIFLSALLSRLTRRDRSTGFRLGFLRATAAHLTEQYRPESLAFALVRTFLLSGFEQ